MTFENLKLEVEEGVALLTFTREKALNALNRQTIEELHSALAEVARSGARALVITGAGKAFVAGADITEMRELSREQAETFAAAGQGAMAKLESLGIPTIAAINGFALGGGCELAMACDLIYASEKAKFGQPEVNLGVIPGFGGTQRLIRRVGLMRAKELNFTGDMISAAQAVDYGLALAVLPPEGLLDHCKSVAKKIASKSKHAIAEAKQVMEAGAHLPLPQACAAEAAAFGRLFGGADQREGMTAFVEKRPAKFEA